MRTLLIGISTRSIAESAMRGGNSVFTLDYFGDRDQKALVENYSLLRDLDLPCSAESLLQASRCLEFESVVYTAGLENHPKMVEQLACRSILLGNEPGVLRQVRDWRTLRKFCCEAEISCPSTLLPGEEQEADPNICWLCKPVHSGGGHGIRIWTGEPLDGAHVLQAYVEGWPASIIFAADGQKSVVIGLTEQLIGQEELGVEGFRWCGNILPPGHDLSKEAPLLEAVEKIASRLTHRFGLRGINGVDLVVAEGPNGCPCPVLVEVNPRWTASVELVERAYGLNVFELHLEALAGRLPEFSMVKRVQGTYVGKGIVFARKTVTVPATEGWAERGRRDIPFSGERIAAGHPVCTVLAEGEMREACLNNLLASADAVRMEIGDER